MHKLAESINDKYFFLLNLKHVTEYKYLQDQTFTEIQLTRVQLSSLLAFSYLSFILFWVKLYDLNTVLLECLIPVICSGTSGFSFKGRKEIYCM